MEGKIQELRFLICSFNRVNLNSKIHLYGAENSSQPLEPKLTHETDLCSFPGMPTASFPSEVSTKQGKPPAKNPTGPQARGPEFACWAVQSMAPPPGGCPGPSKQSPQLPGQSSAEMSIISPLSPPQASFKGHITWKQCFSKFTAWENHLGVLGRPGERAFLSSPHVTQTSALQHSKASGL